MAGTASPQADEIVWTERQRAVLDLLAKGLTNGQVADALGITLDGAKWHVSEIITRLQVDTREEAAEYWRKRNGVVGRLRSSVRRRVSHVALGWLGAGGLAAGVAVVVPVVLFARGDDAPQAAVAGVWERLPDGPLSPRATVIGVWTGEEMLFVGGDDYLCPPNADCVGPDGPALLDGAALDPDTGIWRRIADAPVPIQSASTAVLGDNVYFLASVRSSSGSRRVAFLHYRIDTDVWGEFMFLSGVDESPYRIIAAGDRIIAFPGSHERGVAPYLAFDPASREWSGLPPRPGNPGLDVSMTYADGKLYLLDHELVPNPGSLGPSLTRLAVFDFATETWEELPTTGMLGGFGFVAGGKFVDPSLGGADGGEVNNWGRMYPNGGVIDLTSGAWTPLPNVPETGKDVFSSGVYAADGANYHNAGGHWLLNFETGEWTKMPRLDTQTPYTQRNVFTAGRDAVVFGGGRWNGPLTTGPNLGGELLADAWIWRAPD